MKKLKQKLKEDGFESEQFITLSETDRLRCAAHPVVSQLYPLTFGHFPIAPGHRVHRAAGKRGCMLIYVLSGKGTLALGENMFTLSKGNTFVIPSFTGHTYQADPLHPWSILWVRFEGHMVPHYVGLLGTTLENPVVYMPNEKNLFNTYKSLYSAHKMFYSDLDLIMLSNLLGLFLTAVAKELRPMHSKPLSALEQIQQSMRFMEQNIHRNCTLEELTAAAGMSERHYCRQFQALTGFSPIHYFQQMKINEALHKLRKTTIPIGTIALELGYSDPLYFSRLFHKAQGLSPSEYRLRK